MHQLAKGGMHRVRRLTDRDRDFTFTFRDTAWVVTEELSFDLL